MFVKVASGAPLKFPYTFSDLKADNPQTSFPQDFEAIQLEDYGVYPVVDAEIPVYDKNTHRAERSVSEVDGQWKASWTVEPLLQGDAESNVRAIRDQKLSDSDWTQLSDSPRDKVVWANYRQQLRDLPSQPGFPFTIDWPTPPN